MSKNYSTTVSLNPENAKKRWQFIFASQAYGSFYAVYALFEAKYMMNEAETPKDSVDLKSVNLEIITYKGLFDIGIVDANIVPKKVDANNNTIPLTINIKVQAKNNRKEFPLTISKPIEVAHLDGIETKRHLISLSGHNRDFFRSSSQETISQNAIIDGVFDDEFFFRNGKMDIKLKNDGDFVYQSEEEDLNNTGFLLGNWCIGTTSKVHIK